MYAGWRMVYSKFIEFLLHTSSALISGCFVLEEKAIAVEISIFCMLTSVLGHKSAESPLGERLR
jgi:hypothetical protein